jgi:hypothetical protein
MSFSIRIVRDDEGIRIDMPEGTQPHVPNGVFVVSGHLAESRESSDSFSASYQSADFSRYMSCSVGALHK